MVFLASVLKLSSRSRVLATFSTSVTSLGHFSSSDCPIRILLCLRQAVSGNKVPILWVLGGPGSGKGTQCDRIVAKYHFSHFSTGDLLRDEVKSGSEKGKQLSEMMTRGDLVPNDEVLALLKAAMEKVADSTVGYLIDGYPREKDQGAAFETHIAKVDIILYFECAEDTMVQRILHRAAQSEVKRADDNEETIKNRIHTFRTNTEAILAQYGEKVKRVSFYLPQTIHFY